MRHLIIAILFISFNYSSGYSQTFLSSFKKYRLIKANNLSSQKERKKINRFIKSEIKELDTVFESYKAKTNFDFNFTDTLFIIYCATLISPYTSEIIIWSGNDTISYSQGFETIEPFKYKRIITYQPFIPKIDSPKGFKVVTERDSLITLVSKRDFNIISHLGDNQNISDGAFYTIYVAYKDGGQYKFEACSPKQFIIQTVYRKE